MVGHLVRGWTLAEVRYLVRAIRAGVTTAAAAVHLGRTPRSVRQDMWRHGISARDARDRLAEVTK